MEARKPIRVGETQPLSLTQTNPRRALIRATEEIPEEEWYAILASNLTSVFLCARAVLPVMKRQRHAICVGAEPVSFLDYIAIERATPNVLDEIGRGLYEGARLAGVNIVGEELLRPTHIYVSPVMDLLKRGSPVRALVNVTSDGFVNLARISAKVGFQIDRLPEPHPIFGLIQRAGNVDSTEMYRVFNMGIGFCVIVPNDNSVIEQIKQVINLHNFEAHIIGQVVEDDEKRVFLSDENLVGHGNQFSRM